MGGVRLWPTAHLAARVSQSTQLGCMPVCTVVLSHSHVATLSLTPPAVYHWSPPTAALRGQCHHHFTLQMGEQGLGEVTCQRSYVLVPLLLLLTSAGILLTGMVAFAAKQDRGRPLTLSTAPFAGLCSPHLLEPGKAVTDPWGQGREGCI